MELNLCWLVAFLYLIVSPFTKVEESFSMQAIHDILFHGTNLSQYDHFEYQGVVPRSFLGPLVVAMASTPAGAAARYAFPSTNKMVYQVLVRATMGAFVLVAFSHLLTAMGEVFGKGVANKMIVLTATQFHFLYYATRTLPNTFAMVPVLYALAFWLRGQTTRFILFSGIAILVFRIELVLFFGPCLLMRLIDRQITVSNLVTVATPAAVAIIAVTFSLDSLFWRRWLWPEGVVFWFNVVLNKSSQWGTMPFLWYFFSALPRALLLTLFLVPLGLFFEPRRGMQLLIPSVTYIAVYSVLPHKELRFVMYVFPLFNCLAAIAFDRIAKKWSEGVLYKLMYLGILAHLVVNVLCCGFMLYVSRYNYPGGVALQVLHRVVSPNETVHVHICNLAAQTGVTRFGEEHSHWIYNKTEHLESRWADVVSSFTHVIVEEGSLVANITEKTHSTIGVVKGFSGIDYRNFRVFVEPKLRLMATRGLP